VYIELAGIKADRVIGGVDLEDVGSGGILHLECGRGIISGGGLDFFSTRYKQVHVIGTPGHGTAHIANFQDTVVGVRVRAYAQEASTLPVADNLRTAAGGVRCVAKLEEGRRGGSRVQ